MASQLSQFDSILASLARNRPAIFDRDDRSGGMALWFSVEMERWSRAFGSTAHGPTG